MVDISILWAVRWYCKYGNRAAMNAIFFILRTGYQWNALKATGICSPNSAHRRFQEWTAVGVFERFWQNGLLKSDKLSGIDWSWISLDGCMTQRPRAGSGRSNGEPVR